jgi:DNA-binding transcriptional regulator GbsR (MarR family)
MPSESGRPDGPAPTDAPAPRPASAVEARVLEVCDAIGAFIEWWGFKAVHGRVWALMALRGQPMTQADVGRTLGLSRAGVSGAMHDLERWGLVEVVGEGRTAPWQAVLDVWPTIARVLRSREWMLIESARVALEAAVEEAELARAAGFDPIYDLGRMRTLLRLTEVAQALLRLLVGLRTPRHLEGVGDWLQRAGSAFRNLRG